MKTRSWIVTFIFLFTIYLIFSDALNNSASSHTAGAPATRTGSPGDGNLTCTSCHAGPTASFKAGWITSTIPASGYVPGNTYTITATATRSGHVKFGFEISPQNNAGTLLGTLVVTNTETQRVGSNKYMTHTATGTSGSGSKTWAFDWTAPASGTGNVTFYGAFIATNNSNNSSSDTTFTSTLVVSECTAPSQPGTISGNSIVCQSAQGLYSISPVARANNYTWTLPGGWTGSSTTNSISVTTGSSPGTISVVANGDCGNSQARTLQVNVDLISVSTTHQNVHCMNGNDGSSTAVPVNGTLPYSYSWSPSGGNSVTASNLSAGTYTVTVTDSNSCFASAPATITEPSSISLSATHVNVKCHGGSDGSAAVSAGGGTPGYSYSWSPSGGNAASASNLSAGTYTVTVTDLNSCVKTASVVLSEPITLTTLVIPSNVNCYSGSDGSASVIASGGTPGYTYSWSSSGGAGSVATNLAAGNYRVTVTDSHGCIKRDSVILTQPGPITATTGSTNADCNQSNGTASVTPGGGTPGYTYQWNTIPPQINPTATNLHAANYIVTVTDANACSSNFIATVNNNSSLVLEIDTIISVNCFGQSNGSGTVSATGGTPSYSFFWSPSGGVSPTASGLSAGTYSVTVIDAAGCVSGAVVHVPEPNELAADAGNDFSLCNGDAALIGGTPAVSGGTAPYLFVWDPPTGLNSTSDSVPLASPANTTTYTLTVTDHHSCIDSATVLITVNSLPAVPVVSQSQDTLYSTPATSYQWFLNGDSIPNSINQFHIPDQNGNYSVSVSDGNGCNATSADFIITTVGIETRAGNVAFSVYPNPFAGKTSISYTLETTGDVLLDVYSLTGVKIKTLVNQKQYKGTYRLIYSAEEKDDRPAVLVMRLMINGNTFRTFLLKGF